MRLKTSKSKNATLYYVIKDFTNIKGKRTTKIFEKLGNQEQVEKRFGKINTINKIKEYINELNKEDKDELLKREYNPNKRKGQSYIENRCSYYKNSKLSIKTKIICSFQIK